jgi:DNA polymerase III alpha subunit
MRLDKYNNPIYNSQDVFNLLYQGKVDCLTNITVDINKELVQLERTADILLKDFLPEILSIEESDKLNQQHWFMPEDHCPNLMEMLYGMCETAEQTERVSEELEAFIEHGMMDLLFWLKYFVDTCLENDIVWGVGRGSSVASYVLYLIGVHQIDSMKYNLDWREFLR